ncbi:MAG: ABC transporter permease [Bacteroidota bacterium]
MVEKNNDNNWTEVISPKKGILDVRLYEIWKYRDLIALFVRRDFVSIYKQTILGPLWIFIQPLFTTITFVFVFSRIAKLSTDGIPPVLFYLSGITLWTYFADSFSKTSNIFVNNANIFGKVYFPRLTTPISIIISNLIKFGIQISLFVSIYVYYVITGKVEVLVNTYILLLPILILLMAVLGLGLGIIFSSLTTKYRDLGFLLAFGIQLLMYATPVIYPLSSIEGKFRKYLELNPLSSIIENFRYAIFSQGQPDLGGLVYCAVFSVVVLFLGIIIFNQVEKSFMDTV